MNRARKIMGIECPIIREGDNIVDIVVDRVLKETEILCGAKIPVLSLKSSDGIEYRQVWQISDKDIVGITESVVARAAGQYITVDDIAADVEKKFGKDATICLVNPIYSRNRFSMILKGIARAAKKVIIVMPEFDEVGNPIGVNRFTGINIEEYYKELCKGEGCECVISSAVRSISPYYCQYNYIVCNLHNDTINDTLDKVKSSIRASVFHDVEGPLTDYDYECADNKVNNSKIFTLVDICSDKSPDWGLLGTNKATDERLKLFPSKVECQRVCEEVKKKIFEKTGKDVIVCIYGDGCFKDPVGGIWEFADPVSMPGYTDKELVESTPNEVKLKSVIDSGFNDEQIHGMIDVHKNTNKPHMGTTPRVYRDLLASLMDLTSGSGDKGTPVVLVQNYF